jgi:hypothetical protein
MPCKIKNPSKIDLTSLEPHVQGMYDYFDQKLGFQKPPTMFFDSDPSNQSKVLGKTAYYDPQSFEVHIFVDGRHPKDMLRSIAHELIHHHQNLEGRLEVGGYMGEGYYLKNEEMKKLEQEAMLEGNALMREYEDNLKLEEKNKMSLKEWKNNELNKQLLKKFGILTESEKPDYIDLDKDGDKEESMKKAAADAKKGKGGEEESEEELDEGRNNPRTTNSDKFVGHEDRYLEDRIHEEEEKDDTKDKKKKPLMGPGDKFDNTPGNPKQKKKDDDDDKNPPPQAASLQEAMKRIANAKKVTLKSNGKRIK